MSTTEAKATGPLAAKCEADDMELVEAWGERTGDLCHSAVEAVLAEARDAQELRQMVHAYRDRIAFFEQMIQMAIEGEGNWAGLHKDRKEWDSMAQREHGAAVLRGALALVRHYLGNEYEQ